MAFSSTRFAVAASEVGRLRVLPEETKCPRSKPLLLKKLTQRKKIECRKFSSCLLSTSKYNELILKNQRKFMMGSRRSFSDEGNMSKSKAHIFLKNQGKSSLQELFLQNTDQFETIEAMNHEEFMSSIPPIYVVSRVPNLSGCILKYASDMLHYQLVVHSVAIPEDSNVLNDDCCSSVADAKIVVIDPVFLVANYKKFPDLKWAHCTWAGVEGLFTALKTKPKFVVTKHGGNDFANLMAEYVLSHVLNWERRFKVLCLAQEQKCWCNLIMPTRTLNEITISVLGVGNMAQAIARYFKPHGTKVIALARTLKKEEFFSFFDRVSLSLDEVLSSCDYLVNVLPHTNLTKGMLNGEVLRGCTKHPVFINVGRGSIIDDASLINAIELNWISGAILDVFKEEPLPPSSPLWKMDQVIITPHCAAISRSDHIAQSFCETLFKYKRGEPLANLLNWEAGY